MHVADLIGAHPSEITFTSGATEAANIALHSFGIKRGCRIVTSTIEHSCVRETLSELRKKGVNVVEAGGGPRRYSQPVRC